MVDFLGASSVTDLGGFVVDGVLYLVKRSIQRFCLGFLRSWVGDV